MINQSLLHEKLVDIVTAENVTDREISLEAYMATTRLYVPAYRFAPSAARELMPKLGEYYQLLKKLKRMLDPNHIMNPGKLMDLEPH